MRSWKGTSGRTKFALGAAAIAVLAIVGVVAMQVLPTGGAQEREPETKRDVTASIKPLELGTVAEISPNYRAVVSEIGMYDGPRGPFIAAKTKVKYLGSGHGEPWKDLIVEFAGSGDSRNFSSSTCPVDLGDASDLPGLSSGKTGTFVACSTLSPNRVKGGTVSVVDTTVSTEHRVYWSTTRAVTKKLPSSGTPSPLPTARPSATQRPPAAPSGGSNGGANTNCDEFDEDEFEEYKEWGEVREEQFEAYKDAGGNDEDDIEDYEEWREAYEEQLEYFEKWEEMC